MVKSGQNLGKNPGLKSYTLFSRFDFQINIGHKCVILKLMQVEIIFLTNFFVRNGKLLNFFFQTKRPLYFYSGLRITHQAGNFLGCFSQTFGKKNRQNLLKILAWWVTVHPLRFKITHVCLIFLFIDESWKIRSLTFEWKHFFR